MASLRAADLGLKLRQSESERQIATAQRRLLDSGPRHGCGHESSRRYAQEPVEIEASL